MSEELTPEGYVRAWHEHGRVANLHLKPWERAYQDAGMIEAAKRRGYLEIGRDVACTITLTPLGEAVALNDFAALLACHHNLQDMLTNFLRADPA